MKRFVFYILLTVATLGSNIASAITIASYNFADNALADQFLGSSGNFLNYTSATSADIISQAQLSSDVTDSSAATYVLSLNSNAYIDLGFSTNIYNGNGYDLALFFVGVSSFSLELTGNELGSNSFTSIDTGFDVTDSFGTYALTVALIDLDQYGMSTNDLLGDIRIHLGNSLHPAFSLAGAFNTSPTAVPVPAALLLFLSGIGILGLFGKQKK